jgi:hypothetical protein
MYINCETVVSLRGSVTSHALDGHSSPGGHVHSNIYLFSLIILPSHVHVTAIRSPLNYCTHIDFASLLSDVHKILKAKVFVSNLVKYAAMLVKKNRLNCVPIITSIA